MHLAEELERIDRAEELFDRFGVEFDPRVMAVHRFHMLRRFGIEVQRIETQNPSMNEAERERLYQRTLAEAHAHFASADGPSENLRPGPGPVLVKIRRRPSEM